MLIFRKHTVVRFSNLELEICIQSLKQVNIPVSIAGMDTHIRTDVVGCEIPLLLSKGSLKDADAQLDFVNDNITMYGKEINLRHTSNGH